MPELSYNRKPSVQTKDHPQVYKNLLFEVVLLVVAVGLFWNFLLQPKRHSLAEDKSQLSILNEQGSNIEKNSQDLSALITQMKAAKKDISLLDEALPLNSRITTVHVLLDSIISSSGLTLANITTDTSQTAIAAGDKQELSNPFRGDRQLQSVAVTLNLTGTMDQFLQFLKSLESNARIIDIGSLEITGNKNNLASFRLTLNVYFYGPSGQAQVLGQPGAQLVPVK